MRHQRLDVLWVIHFNRQGTGIELHCHSSGLILPMRSQKRRHRFPSNPPDFRHRLQECFSSWINAPVHAAEPRWQVARFFRLERQAEIVPFGSSPNQRLPHRANRIDAANCHQTVGSLLVFHLQACERVPRFIDPVQPQTPLILRRLNQHVAVGIASRLCPAGAIDARGKE